MEKITCSAGKGVLETGECLRCALNAPAPCGYDYSLLKALYSDKKRTGIHVTDILGCPLKSFWDRNEETPEMPHQMLVRSLGTALHAYIEGDDENVRHEIPVEHKELGLVGTVDILYSSGRLVDLKCQPAGEYVTMADGTEKPIEKITIFDSVLSWDGANFVPSRVTAIMDGGIQDVYEIRIASGQTIRVSGNHPVLTDRGFIEANQLHEREDRASVVMNWTSDSQLIAYLETKLRKGDKNVRRIDSVTNLGPMQTIGLEIENTHTYITNGVITHNTTRWLMPGKLPYGSHALQVNLYAMMLRSMGTEVTSLAIQYVDMSGPSKCKSCRRMYVIKDGLAQCPQCGKYNGGHLGALIYEVDILTDEEIMNFVGPNLEALRAAYEMGFAPEPQPGFLCEDYCAHRYKCPAF